MFEGIKYKLGLRKLRREFKNLQRNAKVVNLAMANSVGIICKIEDENKLAIVKNYVKHLKEDEGIRQIKVLGYFDAKELPEYLKSLLEFDYFSNKELQWNFCPSTKIVKNFCDERFDILIDLESNEYIPLHYVLNWSKAQFKVGFYNENFNHYYDLLIKTDPNNLVDYIAQVNYYLSILNTSNEN